MNLNVRKGMFRLYVVVSSLWVLVVAGVAANAYRPNAAPTYSDIEIEQAILKAEWDAAGEHWGVEQVFDTKRGQFVPVAPAPKGEYENLFDDETPPVKKKNLSDKRNKIVNPYAKYIPRDWRIEDPFADETPQFAGMPPGAVLVPRFTVEFDNNTTTTTVRKGSDTKEGETIVLPVGLAKKESKVLKDIVRDALLDTHRKTERTRLLKYFFNTSLTALGPPMVLLLFWSLGAWIVAGFKSRETSPGDK